MLFLNYFPFNSFLSKYLVVRARDVRLSRSAVLYKQLALVSRVSISSGSEREGIVRHAVCIVRLLSIAASRPLVSSAI